MRVIIDIPDSEVPKKQEIMSLDLYFIDGKVCGCTYPFQEIKEKPKKKKEHDSWDDVTGDPFVGEGW